MNCERCARFRSNIDQMNIDYDGEIKIQQQRCKLLYKTVSKTPINLQFILYHDKVQKVSSFNLGQ